METKHKHISNDTHELTTIQQQEVQIHIKLWNWHSINTTHQLVCLLACLLAAEEIDMSRDERERSLERERKRGTETETVRE